jgi:hypothetical protein
MSLNKLSLAVKNELLNSDHELKHEIYELLERVRDSQEHIRNTEKKNLNPQVL